MTSITDRAESAGQQANNSEWIDHAARIGLIAYGVVHLLIAWLAIQLAFGDKEESADSQGAVQQLDGAAVRCRPWCGRSRSACSCSPSGRASRPCSGTATRRGSRRSASG